MKIAYVTDAVYPYHKGGKEVRLYEISKRLAINHEVHIYSMKWWKGSDNIIKDKVHFHAVCKLYKLYTPSGRRSIFEGIMFGLNCLRINVKEYDIVDVDHMPFFPLFSMKLKCFFSRKKMHATWHEVWGKDYWKEYLGWKGIFGYWIEKMAIKMPDKIISISKHTTSRLINNFKISKNKIHTVPCGVDYEKIIKIKPSAEKSDVIFAGRLLKHKNVDILIKAVSLIKKPIKCIIIGDGPELENLKELTHKLGLDKKIIFKGFVKDKETVFALMKSSKVFVFPSSREGFGIVVLEANACGLPVITVNEKDNAAKELINGKNGFICKLTEKEIAENVINSLNKKDWKTKEYVREYDWDLINTSLVKKYGI